MLRFIIGRSGSGKTHTVYQELKERAVGAAPLFLMVPEQASFESERRLLEDLGPVLSQRVRVLSFTRLAETVFRELGGIAGKRMDTTLSLLMMSEALHGVADSLSLYHDHIDNPEYLHSVLGMLSECKQCTITPAKLEETAAALPNGSLKDKITDLSLIFGAYEALVTQAELIDPQDDLTLLANRLPESALFDGADVYVDSFKGFTQQELLVLERILPRCASVTVTLCAEDIAEREGMEYDRFANAVRTSRQLREIAYRNHITVAAPLRLTKNHRTADPALLALEAGCFAADSVPYDDDVNSVSVVSCTDRAEECRYVARLIRRLLRENGGYARDFTVVARDIDGYTDLLDSALRREGLPCCRDYREPVLTQPLITLIESALAAVCNGWKADDVLRLPKTGLLGFSTASASLLENYAFVWNLRGRAWLSPFEQHPDGLGGEMTPEATRRIAYLELLRRRLIRPLETLRARLGEKLTGSEFAKAVFRYLEDARIARMVRFQVARLDAAGEHALADYQARLWEYTISLLDKFALSLSHTRLSAARFAELFHLAAASSDLGSIPQGLDGVVIGSADRIRYADPKTVIILSANEGVFPAYPSSGGMLTDRERKQLIAAGLPMTDDADWETAAERFYAYTAVAAPSERLVVTYVNQQGGEAALPSSLVETIGRLLGGCKTTTASAYTDSESEADAFATLAATFRQNDTNAASYREVFGSLPAYAGKLEAMRRAEAGFSFQNADLAQSLFGKNMKLSPTQVDTFHNCRFSYFCKYGLRATARETAEMDPAESGILVHHIMQTLLPTYCDGDLKSLTRNIVAADVKKCVTTYIEEYIGSERDAHLDALIGRLTALCEHLMWRVVRELQQSRFLPVDYELPVGRPDQENNVPAWTITAPDGSTISVRGYIDRVDAYRRDGKTYLRVVDYKTGKKEFSLSDVLEGLNLQMLIYLFSLQENGKERYGDIVPAGVLYLQAKHPVIQDARGLSEEEMEKKRLAAMPTSGLLLDDPITLQAMEEELQGIFIPAGLDKKSSSGALKSSSSLASLQQFGQIKRRIQKLLTEMVQQLHNGEIEALPKIKYNASVAEMAKASPCRYCSFRDICGREDSDSCYTIASASLKEALRILDTEEQEVETHE